MTDKQFINWLAVELAEKRSDISDLCQNFLKDGTLPHRDNIEHRYIQAKIPNVNIEIEYDTLTTELFYHTPLNQWEPCIDYKYLNE